MTREKVTLFRILASLLCNTALVHPFLRFGLRQREDLNDRHGRSIPPPALAHRFRKDEEFKSLLWIDWRLAGLEDLQDLDHERVIPGFLATAIIWLTLNAMPP